MNGAVVGALNVLKPPGMSSHDVVGVVRRLAGLRQVGHAGTLDPGAAGVLPVLLGPATRLLPFLPVQRKAYRAEMTLGVRTDTGDGWGRTVEIRTDFRIPPARVGDVLAGFVGEQLQAPPAVSARHHGGERLYELFRRGVEVELTPRRVLIHEIHVVRILPDDPHALTFGARILFDLSCSPGTYVRSLCADAGERLGCGAHLSFLVRTASGPHRLEESHTLEELERAAAAGRLEELLVPPAQMVAHLPAFRVDEPAVLERLRHGNAVALEGFPREAPAPGMRSGPGEPPEPPAGLARVLDGAGRLVCLVRAAGAVNGGASGTWQPVRVLEPVGGGEPR
ncbi:tRNA pseudouridine(55) synthase TruB [Limnochorda pilosa]|uniref:tRNA pseudouridine synthase B n=1 Tax=Limnochorda pilosa TaxID=1555112 RepID=A0A0K2SKJ7_LIMPI|nr:tRNA pseudouridine(55) synthase TruB [Limnochorda pilosa]BAS27542.1 tRNA pseudouridine synthase B [Limnochorda pilosa]